MTSAEQRLFERLAVFVGGFTLEAAETVASADGELGIAVLDGVASLVDQSLVGIKRPYGGLAQPRFELLETIREYASDRLMEAGKAMAVRASHAAYFLALAESLEPHLRGARQAESLANLDQERDNLRAALRCCVEHGAVEQGLRLAVALARFWQMRGYVTEGRKHLSDVLALARDRVGSEPSPLRATALAAAGNLASGQGDYAAAQAQLEASLLIWRALEDRHGIAASLNDLGALASRQGDYGTAHALLAGSLAIKEELGDRWDLAVSLANIGGVAEHQGDYAAARSWLEASLAIFRDVEDTRGIAISLNGLGVLAQDQGQYDAARRLHMESLTISREVRAPRGVASALKNLAWLAMHEGDYAAAYSLYDESLALSRELGDRFEMASMQITLGLVVAKQGDHTAAQRFFEDGMAGARDSGDQILVACALEGFAVLAASQKQVGRALRLAAGAARLRDTIRAPLARREQEFLEREFQQIRQALTVEQAAALWADGQAISEEQLVNYGLGVPAPPAKPMSTGCSQQARPDAMHCAS